jgi:FKBP-type peptidyl-prolyl cis-trans isomerase SlyD
MNKTIVVISMLLAFSLIPGKLLMAGEENIIAEGKTVKFHYTLKVESQVIDSSNGGEPAAYVQGKGDVIPGLEKRMLGMKTGDKQTFLIPSEEGYGPIDPEAFKEVPATKLPEGAAAGAVLSIGDGQGQNMRAIVKEIRSDVAVLDFNHPLAGKALEFDIEVVEVV